MLQASLLSILGAAGDLSFYLNKWNNLGVGYTGFSSPTFTYSLWHPRYRYYQADWYWAPYFEAGFLGGNCAGSGYKGSLIGSDLGFGVNVINEGPLTMEFSVSYPMVLVNWETTPDKGNPLKGSAGLWGYPIPMAGLAFGFVF